MGELKTIPLAQIRENPVALRTVDVQSESFQGLVDSIRTKGFFGAITVRPKKDKDTGEEHFELVDGLHRFAASKEAGLKNINVDIVSYDDDQVLEAQIMANIHKVETKPGQYSKQLRRILSRNPYMTEAELAERLAKSPAWIKDRLSLTKITNEKIIQLIDENKIPLSNAYALAKLPPEEMEAFVDRAMTMKPKEFTPEINARVKELRDADRKGDNAQGPEFSPVAHLQKLKDIKDELEKGAVAKVLCKDLKNPVQGFKAAVEWVLHLDKESIKVAKAEWEERQARKAEAKKKRDEERKKKAAEKAAEKAKEAKEKAAELAAEVEEEGAKE